MRRGGPDVIENHAARVNRLRRRKLRLRKAGAKLRLAVSALQISSVKALLAKIVVAVDDVVLLINKRGGYRCDRSGRNWHTVNQGASICGQWVGRAFHACFRWSHRKLRQKILDLLIGRQAIDERHARGSWRQAGRRSGLRSQVVKFIGSVEEKFVLPDRATNISADAIEVKAPLVRRRAVGDGCPFLIVGGIIRAVDVVQPCAEMQFVRPRLGDDVVLPACSASVFRAV